MRGELKGKRVAILVADGFEQVEMASPRRALEHAGAEPQIVSPEPEEIKSWKQTNWGQTFYVDVSLEKSDARRYDALLLPGGMMSVDKLRTLPEAIEFVSAFFDEGRPVAAICHGPWLLISAGVAHGRRMTAYPSLKDDLRNAGAEWVDEEIVVDHGLVTCCNPGDFQTFNKKMIEEFAAGKHSAVTGRP